MSKFDLKLPEVKEEAKIATIKGIDKNRPDTHVVVKYKGELHSWDRNWIQELANEDKIEVVNEEGNQFKFVGSTSTTVTEDDIIPISEM